MAVTYMCQELKLKDKECERLSRVRNQLEQELEELTASLFEVSNPFALQLERGTIQAGTRSFVHRY